MTQELIGTFQVLLLCLYFRITKIYKILNQIVTDELAQPYTF